MTTKKKKPAGEITVTTGGAGATTTPGKKKSSSRKKRVHFWISFGSGWFVVNAFTKREARASAVSSEGRGMVREVRRATADEAKSYIGQMGTIEDV